MIVFNRLGSMGRTGNQMFQIAACIGIANKCNSEAIFNKWDLASSFNFIQDKTIGSVNYWTFDENEINHFREETFSLKENWQLIGYFQSEKYFKHIESEIRAIFAFNETIKNRIEKKYQLALRLDPISLHVRVGDFKHNGWYIGDNYFLSMAEKFKKRLVIVFSDDIPYCKSMFRDFKNIMYADENEVDSLCLMSMCNTHVISNSTFSWWGAWLSNSNEVYYPDWQSGNYPNNDFYPEQWIKTKI
jgi:hypothetical protein